MNTETLDILDGQIALQITNSALVKVVFQSRSEGHWTTREDDVHEYITLSDQNEFGAGFFISHFGHSKKLTESQFLELAEMTVDEREFCTDPITIYWKNSYNEFFEKYYNNQ